MSLLPPAPDVALIGAGYWGRNLARNFNSLNRLHTICDPDPTVTERFREEYPTVTVCNSFPKTLTNPEIRKLVIAAPASLHFQLAKSALEAGKDVFVEKPLCLDVHEAQDLVSMAKERKCVLMVGHLLQYHPCIIHIQSMLAKGELGRLQYITSNRLNLGKIRREENALWSFAPHDISVILSLARTGLPKQVRCVGEAYLNNDVCDTTLTTLKFEDGIRAHVYVSWLNPFKEQKLTVVGSEGMVVFDDTLPWSEKLRVHRNYLQWSNGQVPIPKASPQESPIIDQKEPLREECQHFLDCCETRTNPRTNGEEGLRVLRVLRAAQLSLERDGEAVDSTTVPIADDKLECSAHPSAVIDSGAAIGAKTRIWHFSHISSRARIGMHCSFGQNTFVAPGVTIGNGVKIQNNVSIYEGVEIEDDVFLGPSCVLTNVSNPRSQVNRKSCYERTLLRRGATIGANATILSGITLGRYCFVAAGSVVTSDVADYALMRGAPARQVAWMSRHGHVLQADAEGIMICPESGLRYQETGPGTLRCLDLPEDSSLPEALQVGHQNYRAFKNAETRNNPN